MFAVIRRLGALVALLLGALAMLASPALAATDATTGHQSLLSDTLIVSYVVTAAISYGIPALTDFITKSTAPSWFKNLVVLGLSAVAAAIPQVTFVHGERWTDYLFAILVVAFPVAQVAHRTGYSNVIQNLIPGGIGPVDKAKAYSIAPASPNDPDTSDADLGDSGSSLPPELPTNLNVDDISPDGNV